MRATRRREMRQAPPESRFLSEAECAALAKRAAGFAVGGGNTGIRLESAWTGNLRFAQNEIFTSGDVRDHSLSILRDIRGAFGLMICNQIDDVGLEATIRRAERLLRTRQETGGTEFQEHFIEPPDDFQTLEQVDAYREQSAQAAGGRQFLTQTVEPYDKPKLFFDSTYSLDAERRAAVLEPLLAPVKAAGLRAAGYIQVSARGRAVMDTWGRALYYPYTTAQYSVTVRDPDGTGSGWAGVDWNDWTRINAEKLSAIAIDKCLRSRNPVALEPGRYTAILEPQAVCDLFRSVVRSLDRVRAEKGGGPFGDPNRKTSRMGQRILDERLTLRADPMDPDLGFVPFDRSGNVYHAATWIERGVLKALAYYRPYGIQFLGENSGLPNSLAFRLEAAPAVNTISLDEMIATTTRGVLVTRFSQLRGIDPNSLLMTGYTRDGLWLVEHGKISKAIKNFRFTESPLLAFNNVEQIGVAQRVFNPGAPAVVPAIKVRDFSFTGLSEAV